eukprot:1244887-Pyramimonas_sp.AAC.1
MLIVAGDLNDGVGITGKGDRPETEALGEGRSPERLPGGAGQKARNYADRHQLSIVNTIGSWRPTYFGEKHVSCIDYIMIPQSMTETMISQGPLLHMGARLQHIRCRARRGR